MGFALLDGTAASIDCSLNSISFKTIVGVWSARMGREFFEQTTFGSGGWRSRVPGMKQCIISMSGFASTGLGVSDPLALFASQAGYAGVFTAFTGCTISGTFHIGSDETSFVAAGNSGRVLSGESVGTVTTTWVVV